MSGSRARASARAKARTTRRVAIPVAALILAAAGCSSTGAMSSPAPTTSPSSPAAPSMTTAPSPTPGSTPGSAPGSAPNSATQITIANFAFSPVNLTVHAGQSVTVVNHDTVAHTLTADSGSFDTGTINPGMSATFTAPAKAGAYPYSCTIHTSMHGTLTVG